MSSPHISDYYTPLYDNERGGPPRAFCCEAKKGEKPHYFDTTGTKFNDTCGHVVRTKLGIIMHLCKVHGIILGTTELPIEMKSE